MRARREVRDQRIDEIREQRFERELLQQQEALQLKRVSQQEFVARRVFKLAADLEKAKLVEEKREFREARRRKEEIAQVRLARVENRYRRQHDLKKEQMTEERFRRTVELEAQRKVCAQARQETRQKKRAELERYMDRLRQEDQRYDFENNNLEELKAKLVSIYKRR